LRGHVDPSEYKHIVLGLIFLKYVSDAFQERHEQILRESADPGSEWYVAETRERYEVAEDRDAYLAEHVFWVPRDARWDHLQANAKLPTIGKLIDDAMVAIETENSSLKGVLQKDYNRSTLDKQRLGELVDLLSGIGLGDRVGTLSKGMIAQLQLALALGVESRLLVLDEPTLGLDALYRKRFFDTLLTGFAQGRQSVVIATHEIDEIQHVLTDVVFMAGGRVVFQCTSDELEERFVEIHVHPEHIEIARAMGPMHERPTIGGNILMFDRGQRDRLSLLGDLRRPSVATLFTAIVDNDGSDSC
jgi:hypothetical protein